MAYHDSVHTLFVLGFSPGAGPDSRHNEAHNDSKQHRHHHHPQGPHQGLPPCDGVVGAPCELHCCRHLYEDAPEVLLRDAHIDQAQQRWPCACTQATLQFPALPTNAHCGAGAGAGAGASAGASAGAAGALLLPWLVKLDATMSKALGEAPNRCKHSSSDHK